MDPTDEQQKAIDLFHEGGSIAIEAGAGTGKSSTLVLIAKSAPDVRCQYTAFNKAIVQDIGAKLPENASAKTAHSMAFRVVGKDYRRRLDGRRMRGSQIAKMLWMEPLNLSTESGVKVLQPDYLAGLVMRTIDRYCQTADGLPGRSHVPYIDGIDLPAGNRRGYANNDIVREHIDPYVRKAWRDIQDVDGQLPFNHGHYLKLWERSDPVIGADCIMFDEAQDASPVMLSIVEQQEDAQVVYVGDSNQAIYEFTGAVDALAKADVESRAMLTQSFRFGPAVADVANAILKRCDTDMVLRGFEKIASTIGPITDTPDAILARTNAGAVGRVLLAMSQGVTCHLVGGGGEIAAFAKGAKELKEQGYTQHRDLACFQSWGEVQAYVEQDAQGDELKLMVKLIDDFGVDAVLRAVDGSVREEDADLIVSTAHKSKGREWDRVQLLDDFPDEINDFAGWRLLYVACTRAKIQLDPTKCTVLTPIIGGNKVPA